MKKFLNLILITFLLQSSLAAQDFALTNPTITPNPGIYPGGTENITFNFSTSQSYTFSSNPSSNNYAYITFSFTKLNPTLSYPTGTGAALFNFVLTNNGGTGTGLVYTYTGTTKDITMLSVPNTYTIVFAGVPITAPATKAETDIRVAGQFTDPGNAPTGLTGNNSAVIATYTVLPSGGPLPLRLLSFNGIKEETKVQLKWQTSSEQNSSYFEVEFSTDPNINSWASLGKVRAAGTSTTIRDYSLTHNSPVDGMNYYRLKQVDINRNVVYSNIIPINFTIKGIHLGAIYPNPFVDKIKIEMSSDRNQTISVQLNDNVGRIIKVQPVLIQNGVNQFWLENLNSLPPGIYNVEVKTAYSTYRMKVKK